MLELLWSGLRRDKWRQTWVFFRRRKTDKKGRTNKLFFFWRLSGFFAVNLSNKVWLPVFFATKGLYSKHFILFITYEWAQ
jgi:hypothetical protein